MRLAPSLVSLASWIHRFNRTPKFSLGFQLCLQENKNRVSRGHLKSSVSFEHMFGYVLIFWVTTLAKAPTPSTLWPKDLLTSSNKVNGEMQIPASFEEIVLPVTSFRHLFNQQEGPPPLFAPNPPKIPHIASVLRKI